MRNIGGATTVPVTRTGAQRVATWHDAALADLSRAAYADAVQGDGHVQYDTPRKLYGKACCIKRGMAFWSDHVPWYPFGGGSLPARELSSAPAVAALLDYVNATYVPDDPYRAVLLNVYRSAAEGIGEHSDRDVHPDEDDGVLMVCLGDDVERTLKFRDLASGDVHAVLKRDGMALAMLGAEFQVRVSHRVDALKAGPGWSASFTFRRHKPWDASKHALRKSAEADLAATRRPPKRRRT